MVHRLPPVHYDVLQYLITFLSRVSAVVIHVWANTALPPACSSPLSSSFPFYTIISPLVLSTSLSPSLSPSLPQVAQNHEVNKMTCLNLAIVLGPNLVWSTNEIATLAALGEINNFTFLLIDNYSDIFEHKP